MKNVKRFICLLLVAFLTLGLVACGSGNDKNTTGDETPAPQETPDNNNNNEDVSDDEEEPAEKKYEEQVTITYACPQVVEGFDFTNGDDYVSWMSEKFNYVFETTNVPWGEWHSMLSTWIMAQNMPDVVIYNYGEGTHADAANFVEQGLIKRLPDDWKTRWPGVAEVYEVTSLGPMLEDLYEGTYFIPRARFFYNLIGNPLADHWSLWMRTDWTEAVGKEVKNNYTIPEVLEIARLFKEEDPGDLGANLVPISMSAGNASRFFLEANSTHWDTFYKGDDGKYVWGAAADQTLEGLKLWYQAFNEGILDPEFYLLEHEQDMEKFQTIGTAGVSYLGAQTADVWNYREGFMNDTGNDPDDMKFATLLGTDGNYHQRDLINFWGAIAFNPDIEDKVFERWMDVMEFQVSEDGYVQTAMGLKGVDWDRDENGDLVSLVPDDVLLVGSPGEAKYPSLGHVVGSVILWDDLAFDNPNIGEEYREESKALYQNRYDLSTPETFTEVDWDIWTHDTENMRRARGIDYATEFANMVTNATSEDNLVELYNNWIEEQMALIQPVLDELNN